MQNAALLAYEKRFVRVMNYINSQLCENLNLDDLCRVANFSKYHFHRQFSDYFGISVHRYIQLLRLKRASYQLAFRKQLKITDIALSSGYENAESFSRAFKNFIGQTPSEFRAEPQWKPWGEKYQPLKIGRFLKMQNPTQDRKVSIVQFPKTRLAALEHRGPESTLGDTIRRFIEWRKKHKVLPSNSNTFNLLYNDAESKVSDQCRIDICAEINDDVLENKEGVVSKTIEAGRCALLRHVGSEAALSDSIQYLYAKWLPQSGEELRDFPVFLHRVTLFPDLPEHENIVDIYLALK
jgi:AraC family transcriptional regulator